MRWKAFSLASSLVLFGLNGAAQTAPKASAGVESGLVAYKPLPSLSGSLSTCGPDSMESLFLAWISGFKAVQPNTRMTFLGRTSDDLVKALQEGSTPAVGLLRELSRAEQEAFVAKWHYAPVRVWVAVNPLAVYVNSNNPILSLSLEDLDAIYSTTRKAGAKASVETWGDLGLMRDWAVRRVNAYCRDQGTATRQYLQNRVLLKGEFKPTVITVADHTALIESPIVDPAGIAISAMDEPPPGTKLVPLAPLGSQKACMPTLENVMKGDYPLARFLYVYLNKAPGQPLPPVIQNFVTFLLSKEGQQIAVKSHQIPVSAEIAQSGLTRLQ